MDGLLFALVWVFGWVLLLMLIWHLRGRRRERRMEMIHKERMMAMEKGIPLPVGTVRNLQKVAERFGISMPSAA